MLRFVALLLALLMLGSCATIFAQDERSVMITSNPPGAEITVNGQPKGHTPVRIKVNDHERLQVSVTKEGFHNGGCYINTSIGARWVIMDVAFFWALFAPVIVDLVTGQRASLDTAYCTVNLSPRQASALNR